jgi:acyl-CoA synthetase (AMP-forming)/AMP-acid ligase II
MLSWLVGKAKEDDLALLRPSGEALRYRDLAMAVQATSAAYVEAVGSLVGRTVALAVGDPAGLLVGLLAALEAGAVPVVVDVRAGRGLYEQQLARARAALVVRHDVADDRLTLEAGHPDPRLIEPEVALVLFTSGSSGGAPKAVALGGRGLQHVIDAILGYLPIDAAARTPIVLPMSYSYALVGQALTTLRAGGAILPLHDLGFAGEQLAAMAAHGATGLSSVPTSLKILARAALELPPEARPQLRYVASAGAPLDEATVALVRQAFPGARLFNQYGLTEASPRVTAISDDEAAFARGSVGRALPGLTVVSVGGYGAPLAPGDGGAVLPPGEIGQLRVSGPSVMLGYLDDPEATRGVIDKHGNLLTGDLGYVDGDGYVFVTGRADDTVKVAGERVSPSEVAGTLAATEGLGEIIVLATTDELTGMRLVAFVAPAAAAGAGAARGLRERVQARARELLPPAKRPTRVVELETLPHLPNGKIDRVALRRMVELGG